jgi:hypothetical protein
MALVEVVNIAQSNTKRSNTAVLRAAFPSTPELDGYDNQKVAEQMDTLHDGRVTGNPDFPNFSLDYEGVDATLKPHVAGDVQTGAQGLPWTAYSPNVASPTVPGANPNDIPAPPPGSPRQSRAGSDLLPGITSPQIASQSEGGGVVPDVQLDKGHSGATS